MRNYIKILVFFLFSMSYGMQPSNWQPNQNRTGVHINGMYYPFYIWFFGGNTYAGNLQEDRREESNTTAYESLMITTLFCFEPHPSDPNLYLKRTKRRKKIVRDRITESYGSDSSDTDSSDESETEYSEIDN